LAIAVAKIPQFLRGCPSHHVFAMKGKPDFRIFTQAASGAGAERQLIVYWYRLPAA